MTLTNKQLYDLLKPTLDGLGVRLFQQPGVLIRRPFGAPFIDISNEQPTGNEADNRITNVTQIFVLTLRMRTKKPGEEEINKFAEIENAIITKLDSSQLAGATLFTENKIWKRSDQPVEKPVTHYKSVLRVLVNDILSTTGDGQILGKSTLTIGTDAALQTMQMLDKPSERHPQSFTNRREDTLTRKGIAPTGDTFSFFGTIEKTLARKTALETLFTSCSVVACTHNTTAGPENFNGVIVDINDAGQFGNVMDMTVQIERVP